jgi:hypothetical protein
MFPRPITPQNHLLLRVVDLLKFYENVNSLKGKTNLLMQLTFHWDRDRKASRNPSYYVIRTHKGGLLM